MPDLLHSLLDEVLGPGGRLIMLSNRGPITFDRDPHAAQSLTAARGPGGLVTALAEIGRLAPVTWVAPTLTDSDPRVARPRAHLDEPPPAGDGAPGRRLRALV